MKKLFLAGAGLAVALSAAALAQAPQKNDANRDGIRTRAEVTQRVQTMFTRLDTNRDGFVTQGEGQAAMAQHRAQRAADPAARKQRGDRMFERLDTNRDGSISRAEFEARPAMRGQDGMGRRGGHGMHDLGAHMFAMADANRDSRVSLQEATTAALQHFDRADVNRDGQVTREERRQMHQQMRQQQPQPQQPDRG